MKVQYLISAVILGSVVTLGFIATGNDSFRHDVMHGMTTSLGGLVAEKSVASTPDQGK